MSTPPTPRVTTPQVAKANGAQEEGGLVRTVSNLSRQTISDIGKRGTEIFEKSVEKGTEIKGQAVEMIEAGQARMKQEAAQAAYVAKEKTQEMKEFANNDRGKVTLASAAGGAVIVGVPCAAGGLLVGGTVGLVVGLLPALFTFGLSIPIGAVIGAGCGVTVVGGTGGAVGCASGGFLGYRIYTRRKFIRKMWKRSILKTKSAILGFKDGLRYTVQLAFGKMRERRYEARVIGTTFASYSKVKLSQAAKNEECKRGAACAVAGGVVLGAGGGAAGAATGGLVGAVVGLPAALFTFGLSIPFCAVVGGGVGLATGAAVGGTVGTVGGAGGYYAWVRREAIRAWSAAMAVKAREAGNDFQETARRSASDFHEKAGQAAQDLRQAANEFPDRARQSASEFQEKARQSAGDLQERASDLQERARQSATDLQEKARQSASDIQAKVNERFSPTKKSN